MSVASLSTTNLIKQGIKANIDAAALGIQVSDYINGNPMPPAADMRRGPVDYNMAFDPARVHLVILVRVFVTSTMDKAAQALLDSYLDSEGDSSIKAAIESDPTLGGVAADINVSQASGEQTYSGFANGAQLIGSEWTVHVWL